MIDTGTLAIPVRKKNLTCLGCGTPMWTDPAHRMCKKCKRRNEASPGEKTRYSFAGGRENLMGGHEPDGLLNLLGD